MADEIQSTNITISGVEDTGTQVKVRDQNRRTFSFFKTKKDGAPTEAYKTYQQFKIGDTVSLIYKEVPYKEGTIRNAMMFRPPTGEPEKVQAPQSFRQRREDRPGREYWEQRESKRQSSILLQVAFKAAVALEVANIQSGGQENHDNVYNSTLEFYDWMGSRLGEGGPDSPHEVKNEAGDDELIS